MNQRGLLFITLFNSIFGLSVLFPVLAPLGRELGLREIQIGMLSTSYALMQFVSSPAWGRRSERVGRKPVLLMGIVGYAVSFFAFAVIAHWALGAKPLPWLTFALLLATRLGGGLFSSATIPTAQAYMADTTGRAQRASGMALLGAAFGLGIIVGPAVGALLSHFGLLVPVYFSASFALLNAVFVALRLPESRAPGSARPEPRLSPTALRLWPLLAVGLSVSVASVTMEQTLAFYYQDRLGLGARETARAVGLALVYYGVVAVIAQGFIVRRFHWQPLNLVRAGLPIAVVGLVTMVFAQRFLPLTVGLSLQGLGQALALPGVTAALSLGATEDEQGVAAGLSSSAQAFGRMVGPIVGTSLYGLRPEYPYVFSAGLLAVVILFVLGSRRLLQPEGGAAPETESSASAGT